MTALSSVLAAIATLAQQEPTIFVRPAPGAGSMPCLVTCGLVDVALERDAPWTHVTLRVGGAASPGVIVRRPFGAVVRATVAGLPPGRETALRLARPLASPREAHRLHAGDGEALWEDGAFSATFLAFGAIASGDLVCELAPAARRAGRWELRDQDPLRAVLVWKPEDPSVGAVLYAVVHAGAPGFEATLLLEPSVHGPGGVAGLRFHAASEGPPPGPACSAETRPEEEDEEPPEPSFEEVLGDLASAPWRTVALRPAGWCARVRSHGPAAPVACEPRDGPATLLVAIQPHETPRPGDRRLLRAHVAPQGPWSRGPGGLARPGATARSVPGLGRGGAPGACRATAHLARKLDAAVAALRSDPRHGLLHRASDLGDWKLDAARVGNLEWDTSLGFLVRFLDRGEPVDAWQALCGVEHLLLRDRDPATGLFFQHGPEHQSGVVEAGHHWAEGFAAVAAWTDDPWLEDDCRRLAAAQIAAFAGMDPGAALPRSLGWALTALCALHAVAPDEQRSRDAILRLERFLASRQGPSGHFALEPSSVREGASRVAPFVDGGIVLPALERARRITRRARTADVVRRARGALLRDAIDRRPEGPVLSSSLLIDEKSGRVVGRAGAAEGEEIVLFLAGVGLDDARARELLAAAEVSLALDRRVYLGKPVSMLMRALPALAARCR
jgi:hypothetical protein